MTPESPNLIRITREEATSQHVDDMLRRQASLRGEGGVSRDRSRAWYYQNWFVFALVGGVATLLAWALIEPVFDDMLYVQGTIESVDLDQGAPQRTLSAGNQILTLQRGIVGRVTVDGLSIHLLEHMVELRADGTRQPADLASLRPGMKIGLWGEHASVGAQEHELGIFLVSNPTPATARKSTTDWSRAASRNNVVGLSIFAIVAGLIGLFIGAADGLVCRTPRRALLCGGVGLVSGLLGGFVFSILANLVYAPINQFALGQGDAGGLSSLGFAVQIGGRSLAWALAGLAMGLGQGLALRSRRLAVYGLLGGVLGGLLGGLLFDPIDLVLLGTEKPSAHVSRLVGFLVIGLAVGGLIGVVELLARDAWLRMTQGPLAGKEFLLFKDVMKIGASPRSDLYLFNDPLVAPDHAVLRTLGDDAEIECLGVDHRVQVNQRSVRSARLRHGDTVTIGRTSFLFQRRQR